MVSGAPPILLPRGGLLIHTSIGNVQFGCPPETIKDTMKLEGGVPTVFIIPQYLFDIGRGVASAEMEFPVYFNFFIKQEKTIIVCTPKQRDRIETVLSEAVFGPDTIDITPECIHGRQTPGWGDLKTESAFFKKLPMLGGREMTMEDIASFQAFDEVGETRIGSLVIRRDAQDNYEILDNGFSMAVIDRTAPIMPREGVDADACVDLPFQPPLFGITTLGSGHGFDPHANTSGMIIWLNRRGVIVDPPVHSTRHLQQLGVNPKLIDNLVLTHCHADHDAGTLQKLLQEGKLNLYTTPTVFNSFLRKSAALTGIDPEHLKPLVNFYPVTIGNTMNISGGKFCFSYTLHSIPTISFTVAFGGKSVVYSSDTLNDPAHIDDLHARGVLSEERRNFLKDFPWDKDVIFHEAGMPPLHTPIAFLCSLPEAVRQRMYLVHVARENVPPDSGLRIAPTGLDNTLCFDVDPMPYEETIEMLNAIGDSDVFGHLPLHKARQFLLIARKEHYSTGQAIFEKGDLGDTFYIVIRGLVEITMEGKPVTICGPSDFFGEKSLFADDRRTATAAACTATDLLAVDKEEMLGFLRGTDSEKTLRHLALFQSAALRDLLNKNPIFRSLTPTQQTQLHSVIDPAERLYVPGQTIEFHNDDAPRCFIIKKGRVAVLQDGVRVARLSDGALVGIRHFLSPEGDSGKRIVHRTETPVDLYRLVTRKLKTYLDKNPGIWVKLYHYPY